MATYTLGRKQRSSHEDWVEVLDTIEDRISRREIEALVKSTVDAIRRTLGSESYFAFAWSGGKDSQVLGFLLHRAGYRLPSVLGICDLEYPAFLKWVDDNKPPNLEIINTGQDLNWLSDHPEFLFPQEAKISARWFASVQQAAQDAFLKANNLSGIVLGRRIAEGNHVGKNGYYENASGLVRYNPIMDWKHEDVLAAMHYYKLAFAPYYFWPRGFRVGSGPWAKRRPPQGEGSDFCWRELLQIDRSIVKQAAQYFPGAAEVL